MELNGIILSQFYCCFHFDLKCIISIQDLKKISKQYMSRLTNYVVSLTGWEMYYTLIIVNTAVRNKCIDEYHAIYEQIYMLALKIWFFIIAQQLVSWRGFTSCHWMNKIQDIKPDSQKFRPLSYHGILYPGESWYVLCELMFLNHHFPGLELISQCTQSEQIVYFI